MNFLDGKCKINDNYNNIDLSWVNEFITQIKPFIYLREIDKLLIILPNTSYKLNSSGFKILKDLISGRKIEDILEDLDAFSSAKVDLLNFFSNLKAVISGSICDQDLNKHFDVVQYKKPWHLLPILSEVAITYKCNLKCKFCYASLFRDSKSVYHCVNNRFVDEKSSNLSLNNYHQTFELTTDKFKIVLYKIKNEAQVPSVSFTGGEPCLREDLITLVEYASSIGLRTNLITNGTLIDQRLAKDLKKAGLASVQISLEATNPTLHDYITGVNGSFERTLQAVKLFINEEIPVHTNTTISKLNLDDIYNFPNFVRSLGVNRFSMNLVIPSKWMYKIKEDLILKYSDIGGHIIKLQSLAKLNNVKFMWYSPTPYCIFNPIIYNLGNKGCAACDGLLSIAPNGQIIPCSCFFAPQGSIIDNSFSDIWNSSSAKSIRNKDCAPRVCKSCKNFEICEGACPIYWNTVGTKELQRTKTDYYE